MSAAPEETPKRRVRPPSFTAYEEVSVNISPRDLERAGWRYVGKEGEIPLPAPDHVIDVVRRWHDDEHDGPWRWCRHPVCDGVRHVPVDEDHL